jgi:hypothetical protein
MARPTKLTAPLAEAITLAVQAGIPLATAAARVGIASTTVQEWMRRGSGTDKARRPTGPYAAFAAQVRQKAAQFEAACVARITEASRGGQLLSRRTTTHKNGDVTTEEHYTRPEWTASAWILERSYPDRWGRKDRLDLRVSIETAARKVADSLGLTAAEVLEEAQLLLRELDQAD